MSEQPPPNPPPPQAYPYPAARPTEARAIAALVTGLLSPFAAMFYGIPGVLLGSVAVFFGLTARSRIKRSGGALSGGGLALAGSIVGLAGIVVGVVWFLFLFALYMAMTSSSPGSSAPPIFPSS